MKPKQLLLLGALALAGCGQVSDSTEQPTGAVRALAKPVAFGADQYFSEVAALHPGFAGAYFKRDGTLVVRMKKSGDSKALLSYLEPFLKTRFERWHNRAGLKAAKAFSLSEVVVQDSSYAFDDLLTWSNAISQRMFGKTGVNSIDIRETENKVVIGVDKEQNINPNLQKLRQLGIPNDAFRLVVQGEIRNHSTLSDPIRPEVGGLKIYSPAIFEDCTISFNSYWKGMIGFWTSDHCTYSTGVVDKETPDPFFQPTWVNEYRIGAEADDQAAVMCPTTITNSYKCRNSDAAFIAYDDQSKPLIPEIARPSVYTPGGDDEPVYIDPYTPAFTITGITLFAMEGDFVEKVGKKTGWTGGYVTSNCSNFITVSDPRARRAEYYVNRICQETADYESRPGDSGSPVFYNNGDGTITLVGIHAASSSLGEAIFSDFYGIQEDYGALPIVY
ncbi:hypothetical protein [Deinococcus enclensis]|uniref:Serine protease n=1 Tax=Deinococcus enclensis TaxID=1049582 RepID=A0ABT9MHP4_9DEIO|nr:hypothetical protein [Deinococcus enclensis]MDP9766115.1 hypothetical protein [Deinococcus enclensis]